MVLEIWDHGVVPFSMMFLDAGELNTSFEILSDLPYLPSILRNPWEYIQQANLRLPLYVRFSIERKISLRFLVKKHFRSYRVATALARREMMQFAPEMGNKTGTRIRLSISPLQDSYEK